MGTPGGKKCGVVFKVNLYRLGVPKGVPIWEGWAVVQPFYMLKRNIYFTMVVNIPYHNVKLIRPLIYFLLNKLKIRSD